MKTNGFVAMVLYLVAFAFFMAAMYRLEWVNTFGILGAIFFIVATVILALMIKKRSTTRRS